MGKAADIGSNNADQRAGGRSYALKALVRKRVCRMRYGCVFCRAGRECAVAQSMRLLFPWLDATPLSQMKHRSVRGVKTAEERILLPGYVFFQTSEVEYREMELYRISDAFRLLKDSSGEWALSGKDAWFAGWVFEQGGLVQMSEAYEVGDRVVVRSGPLKSFEGQLLRIDKRSRNGLVEFRFDERVWRVWLGFELVEG